MPGALALPRVGLLVNPTAGKGRGRAYGLRAYRVLETAGHRVVDLTAVDADSAAARARAALDRNQIDVLVVVGGDGMAHLGANLCAGGRVPLAVVAAGTGNDNARELGLPIDDPEAAAALVTAGDTRPVDLGCGRPTDGESHWWLGVLGAGFDAVVAERAARMRWPTGPMRYNLAIARELPVFRSIPFALTVDGVRRELEAMLVAVGNGPAFGGGMRVAPDARYDDGLLDVVVLHRVSRLDFLRVFPRVYAGTHLSHPQVEVLRGREVRLETFGPRPLVAQADGERYAALPLDLSVVPGALRVVTLA